LKAQNKEDEWYIDSVCSTHMTRDQNKFINLKEGKSSSVAFGNNSSVKILGKDLVDLGSDKAKAFNLTFNSRKSEIIEVDSGRMVATAKRNPNNIYILDKVKSNKIEASRKNSKDNNREGKNTQKEGELLLSAIKA